MIHSTLLYEILDGSRLYNIYSLFGFAMCCFQLLFLLVQELERENLELGARLEEYTERCYRLTKVRKEHEAKIKRLESSLKNLSKCSTQLPA